MEQEGQKREQENTDDLDDINYKMELFVNPWL